MKLKKYLFILFFILLISQPFIVGALESREKKINDNRITQCSLPKPENEISINGFGGEEYIEENIVPDGSFTERNSYNGPEYFNYWGSGETLANASYQDEVHTGTYSGLARAKGTTQSGSSCYQSHSVSSSPKYPSLNESIILDFWYNPKSNPDLAAGGNIYLYLQIYSGTQYYYLYYTFSGNNVVSSNSTGSQGSYDLRGSLSSWLHFARNLTEDFEEAIGPIAPNLDLNYMAFPVFSPINPTGYCELILDDFTLTNGTAYDYMNNGDFETGTGNYWSSYSTGPGSAFITNNDSTEGTTSLNLTASSARNYGSSYINCERNLYSGYEYFPKGPVVNQPEDVIISFDWKYSDTTNGGSNQEAYFSIYGRNSTFSFDIRYYLGEYDDTLSTSNTTSSSSIRRCYAAEGFGTRDTWHSFYLDLYDIISEENMTNVPLDDIGFDLNAGNNANSTVQLLVDDVNVICYPTIDPSFEGNIYWASDDPISLWRCDDHPYTNITSDSHSGNLAANVTAFDNNGYSRVYRSTFLPIQNNLYTDFWWKINTLTTHTSTYSFVILELNESYEIIYVLGSSTGTSFSNTSSSVYLIIDEHNTIGTWTNLVRNVAKDVKDVYGKENLVVTEVTLYCYSSTAGAVVSTIFDDIHFIRDTNPPDISSVTLQNTPTYYEGAIIDVTASDALNDVTEVVVYYQNETSWCPQLAEYLEGDTYRAMIPVFEYGTTCNYYVEVFDTAGHSVIDDNSGANYSYTVIDDIDPYLSVFGPTEGSEISNEIIFYLDASDVGSGISGINITIGDSYSFDNDTVPDEFTLDTTLFDNGEKTAVFTITDGAGNTFTVSIDYTIANTAPILLALGTLFNWGTLVGAGVVALGFGIYFLVRLIKIKKTS